jgi:hypothetical protein
MRDATLGPLIKLLGNPSEESRRIKVRIIEGLAELGLPLADHAAALEKAIADLGVDAKLDRDKRVKVPAAK